MYEQVKYLLYEYSNENKKYFKPVRNRFKKMVQEKIIQAFVDVQKNCQKAKLLNDYVKIVPKNCSPNFCKKVATNLTAQICFKSSLRLCE